MFALLDALLSPLEDRSRSIVVSNSINHFSDLSNYAFGASYVGANVDTVLLVYLLTMVYLDLSHMQSFCFIAVSFLSIFPSLVPLLIAVILQFS